MIVEFRTTRQDLKESHERMLTEETIGQTQVPFEREEDYISKLTVDLKDVIDFVEGRVYINGKRQECVYARCSNDFYTDNLLVGYDLFKSLWEKANGEKVLQPEDILL